MAEMTTEGSSLVGCVDIASGVADFPRGALEPSKELAVGHGLEAAVGYGVPAVADHNIEVVKPVISLIEEHRTKRASAERHRLLVERTVGGLSLVGIGIGITFGEPNLAGVGAFGICWAVAARLIRTCEPNPQSELIDLEDAIMRSLRQG